MRRREFIVLVGGASVAKSRVADAQQSPSPKIGFLSSIGLEETGLAAFRRRLAEIGYVEGRNVSIEYRHADGNYDRLSKLAAELVSTPVKLIVAVPSSPAAVALQKVTSTIPVVFFMGVDPVQLGLVSSYSRPGGNMTGVVTITNELTPKRFELLHSLLPASFSIAFLVNPSNSNDYDGVVVSARQAARTLGRELVVVGASEKSEIEPAFETMKRQNVGGLVVLQEAALTQESGLITTLAARYAMPAVYGPRIFAEVGGLMSYGPDRDELYGLTGGYAGKILRGASPADLPVLQPTKFELVINLQTARVLGLTIPALLLATADKVIE